MTQVSTVTLKILGVEKFGYSQKRIRKISEKLWVIIKVNKKGIAL